ncbi:MAG: hypothetical protein FJW80_11330 [Actinobacteria bacterium]|nr:hypothetical protein [Actinomycetota bacterium]
MILETILFTALPTSRKGADMYASVLISPQLLGEEGSGKRLPLSKYRDFREGTWASTVAAMQWNVVVRWSRDDSQEDILDAARISPDPDRALFALMFPNDMPVDPFRFRNPANAKILAYPAVRLDSELADLQATVARQSPEARPANDWLVTRKGTYARAPLDGFVLSPERRQQMGATIDSILQADGVLSTPAGDGAESTALSVAMLERLLKPSERAGTLHGPTWPELDFHQVVSLLQSHPNLLRRLGLLVDLRISASGLRRDSGNPRVYAMTDWPPPYDPDKEGLDITTAFPRVSTTLTASYFRPKPRTGALKDDGYVDLTAARAITSTLESEVIATEAEATGIARMFTKELETFGTPEHSGIPARHSAGVEIARADEPKNWRARMIAAGKLSDALLGYDDILVDAEDLLMGYRVDVRKAGERGWRSLHRRHGVLTPYAGKEAQRTVDLGDDEGWSEVGASSNPEDVVDGMPTVMRLRETLALWSGWSLSLPGPDRSLNADDRTSGPTTAADAPDLIASMHGTIDYAAPPSGARLPALRFSTTQYQARLRWVDVGGNSLGPDATGGSILTFPYLRHDPVPSPALHMNAQPVWSETVEVMVLRTGNEARTNRRTAQRWIAPPKSAASFCLLHGVFDDAQGRPRADAYATIADRESAALPDGPIANDPGAVPYLPDPLARGLFVRGLPRRGAVYTGEESLTYRGTWPRVEVASIVADGSRANGATVAGDRLTVGLEPGRVAHLRLSHSMSAQDLQLMDLWKRISSFGNAARARQGAYWLLTPDRVLVVVHAVQRPVAAPAFVTTPPARAWKAVREAGETSVTLSGRLTVDQPSSESVDIVGRRTYAVDDGPGTATPRVIVGADMGVIGSDGIVDPAPGGGEAEVPLSLRAAFADTRRQQLVLTAEAKSRFAEYFRTSTSVSADASPFRLNGGRPIVEGSVRVSYTTFDDTFQPVSHTAQESAYTVDAPRGVVAIDPNAPAGDRIPNGSLLSISFIPGPITRASTESTVPVKQRQANVTVPSSARPLVPQAEWILPAFRWEGPSGANRTSIRRGGSLRVYLARPWFTSGVGEELAIVLRPRGGSDDTARDALVTQWGQDPITTGGALPTANYPTADRFDSDSVARGVRLAEMNATVDVVRYPLGTYNGRGEVSGYDADRDMWFVDLAIDHGDAYRPFVRLAFARYQPSSVDELQLSPVALVDVVQLEPDRTASVAINRGAKPTASITLTGRSYATNEIGSGPGLAVAILERYDGPVGPKSNPTLSAAWTQLQTAELSGRVNATGAATWEGRLFVPEQRPANRYRIVIEQYERIRTDGDATPWSGVPAAQRAARTGQRLVHQDIIGI